MIAAKEYQLAPIKLLDPKIAPLQRRKPRRWTLSIAFAFVETYVSMDLQPSSLVRDYFDLMTDLLVVWFFTCLNEYSSQGLDKRLSRNQMLNMTYDSD